MPGPPLGAEDEAHLSAALLRDDVELAASILQRHLHHYHHDCSWCDTADEFPSLPTEDIEALLLHAQSKDNARVRDKRKKEDRFDFNVFPDVRPAVRLRRAYCASPVGMIGSVWCDRVHAYLLSRGCLENVGIDITEVAIAVPKPLQLTAAVTLQAVLETDYRFDVIPFHKHDGFREIIKNVNVPACAYSSSSASPTSPPTYRSSSSAALYPSFISTQSPAPFLPAAPYLSTTKMGVATSGWTDVGTTISAFISSATSTHHCVQSSEARVYRPAYSTFIYIRENPVYTFQFRGVTDREDCSGGAANNTTSNSSSIDNNNNDGKNRISRGGRRQQKKRMDAADPPNGSKLVTTQFLPGICTAAGAIYRQRLQASSSVLVYHFHEYIGKHSDADYGAYVALRIGLQRCLENGFTPLILESDNLRVMENIGNMTFKRTLGNYLQEQGFDTAKPMILELIARNESHQEALLAATTVKYINKDKLRAERLPGMSYVPISTCDVREKVAEESLVGLEKGAMLDRGWASGLY